MNSDGTGLADLTNTDSLNEVSPAWSPDATRIVFSIHEKTQTQLYIMNADGRHVTQITNDPPPGDSSPDWQALPQTFGGAR
jgi:Tol biopolymer transport system component